MLNFYLSEKWYKQVGISSGTPIHIYFRNMIFKKEQQARIVDLAMMPMDLKIQDQVSKIQWRVKGTHAKENTQWVIQVFRQRQLKPFKTFRVVAQQAENQTMSFNLNVGDLEANWYRLKLCLKNGKETLSCRETIFRRLNNVTLSPM